MNTEDLLKQYYERRSELYKLGCITGLLGWDQRVYMPPEAAKGRSEQLQYMTIMMHGKSTDPVYMQLVDDLYQQMDSLSPDDQVNIRETKREIDIERKLPEDFVSEFSKTRSMSYNTWVKARPADDFSAVEPYLEKLVDLSKKKADLIGYEDHPYDALLDLFEPGAKTVQVKPLLLGLADRLKELIPQIYERFKDVEAPKGPFDVNSQQKLAARIVQYLGFNFESGRLDTTAHPFMTSLGPSDFRITTRYDESSFLQSLYGTIHETGHALYDMGLPKEYVGTPMGESVSLGIHESQSRMWENLVGRSREFCRFLSRILMEYFPDYYGSNDPDILWKHVNRVRPSLIRIEADEVTYNQHIVIRMLLEIDLVTGVLNVKDLPSAWNDLYEKYLGIHSDTNKNGVMQDVHWYSGSFGYFPTYSLGNLYGAMMMEKAKEEIPDLSSRIETGEFSPLLGWLQENVYRHGMRYRGQELIRNITGKELSADAFVRYVTRKFLPS